jgi:hypothetical protein
MKTRKRTPFRLHSPNKLRELRIKHLHQALKDVSWNREHRNALLRQYHYELDADYRELSNFKNGKSYPPTLPHRSRQAYRMSAVKSNRYWDIVDVED